MVKSSLWAATLAGATVACSSVYMTRSEAGSAPSLDPPGARAQSAPPQRAADRARGPAVATSELAAVLGSLVWPLATDRGAVLSSVYGPREHPVDDTRRFHAGLDLRAPEGTPIYAAGAGRVTKSGVGGAYGNVVVVDHGGGLVSLYGHNRENLVREGDLVRRGQVVALVGHSGNATGDHLHFELRWRDGTVDPRVALPRLSGTTAGR